MGFFRGIVEVGEIFADFGKEMGQVLSDGRKEFTELMTDGVKEMVIKRNNDYKTSYEKTNDANKLLCEARARYNMIFNGVQNKINDVEIQIENHYAFKMKLYEEIKCKYGSTVEKYVKYRLRKKEFNPSQKTVTVPFRTTATVLATSIGLGIIGKVGGIAGVIGMDLIEQKKRVSQANALAEEAKEIQAKLKLESVKLEKLKTNLKLVESNINEERSLIERLYNPLQEKMKQTEELMMSSFNMDSNVNEVGKAIEIIMLLEKLLTTQFLQDSAVITKQYKDLTKQLHILVEQL